MKTKYSLVIESSREGFNADVPELPSILITGANHAELTSRAKVAIPLYWKIHSPERDPKAEVQEIEREPPA